MKLKRDWANLEALPLSLILDNLEERMDHVWFGAVCKNWQSIAKLYHENDQFKINTLPMLVMPKEPYWAKSRSFVMENKWSLYSIPHKRHYHFYQFNQLCLANPNLRLCGSSHGWFALIDDSTSIITLIKPFIKDIPHIILPPLNLVYKVTLSADPIKCPNDYMVAAIYDNVSSFGDGKLALMRRGQTFWTYIDTSKHCFYDVIFYKNLLFGINMFKKMVSFNTITSDVCKYCLDVEGKYLVKSLEEELWMVKVRNSGCDWAEFHVYKLELDAKNEKVEQMFELKCLGDNVLFVGICDSISVSASYFSKSLQRDSIYFARCLRVYDVKNEKYTYHCFRDAVLECKIWIQPHFQWNCERRLPHELQGEPMRHTL